MNDMVPVDYEKPRLNDEQIAYLAHFADTGILGRRILKMCLHFAVWVGSVGGAIAGLITLLNTWHNR